MEFYGSLHLISGSVTASYISGTFIGDGSGLSNIPLNSISGLTLNELNDGNASVVLDELSGLTINANTKINGDLIISGSTTFKGSQNISGSIIPTIDNAFDLGSPTYQWRDVYISSGSLYIDGTKVLSSTSQELQITTDNGQSIKILEGTTDSIILQVADGNIELKSSADGDILLDPTNGKILLKGPVEVLSGQKIQSSVGGTPVVFANDIVISGSIDLTGTIEGINLTDLSSSLNGRIGSLESGNTSLNSFTSSAGGRLSSLETESGSIRTVVNNYTSSTDGRLSSIETVTGSVLTTNTTQTNRLDSIELKTGSYATTGSNQFNGNQTITGSLTITQNLTVLGSSSLLILTSSQLAVSSSTISVNVFEPAERFGGLKVYDSGSESHLATASLLWDSQNNHWIYQNASGSSYSGGMLLSGPRNTGSLGDEVGLTSGKIAKSVGGDHLDNSIITETGEGIGISGSLSITGSIVSSMTPIVSGSSQISFNGITDKPTLVSGSSQVSFNTISDKPSLVSGSSQITFGSLSGLPSLVSGSSQISFTGLSNIPGGLVSGSVQIDLTTTTNYSSGIKTRLNAEGIHSGSFLGTATTANLSESGNLYYTDARARTAHSFTAGSGAYNSTTGVITIPTNTNQLTNGAGYITSYTETDTLGSVTNRGSSTSQNITFSNGRKGLVGVYDAAQTQAIFAMGASYTLTDGGASGTIGNHYGLAWSYNPGYGGAGNNPQSKAGLEHQLLIMNAGTTYTALGVGIWTSGGVTCGTVLPLSNNSYNLGSTGTRWANIYTNDLHLSNEGKEGGNEIDGTTGDWTIQEGEENLYIINHKNGKRFKINLTEVE